MTHHMTSTIQNLLQNKIGTRKSPKTTYELEGVLRVTPKDLENETCYRRCEYLVGTYVETHPSGYIIVELNLYHCPTCGGNKAVVCPNEKGIPGTFAFCANPNCIAQEADCSKTRERNIWERETAETLRKADEQKKAEEAARKKENSKAGSKTWNKGWGGSNDD